MRFGAVAAEVSDFLTVTASDVLGIAWLFTLLRHVALLSTIVALVTAFGGTVFSKVTHYVFRLDAMRTDCSGDLTFIAAFAFDTFSRTRFWTLRRLMSRLPSPN